MKKLLLSLLCLFCVLTSSYGQVYGKKQLIPAGHWVYDYLDYLNNSNKSVSMADMAPLSVEELELYFNKIDKDSLSGNLQQVYSKVQSFFETSSFSFDLNPVKFGINFQLNPTFFGKTNENIPWSFEGDYSGHFYNDLSDDAAPDKRVWLKNLSSTDTLSEYGASSAFAGSLFSEKCIQIPFFINFDDVVLMESEYFITSNYWGLHDSHNWFNYPLQGNQWENFWPNNTYLNAGKLWDTGWGLSLNIAIQGFQNGKTLTGSIIYNNTFQTTAYYNLNLYSERMKYNLLCSEVDQNQFVFLHMIDFKPLKNLKIGFVEGNILNDKFDPKYLNPLMIIHSYASWNYTWQNEEEKKIYDAAHSSSYMGAKVEYSPVKNMDCYFLFCFNEFQLSNEKGGKLKPNAYGVQLGGNYLIDSLPQGLLNCQFEFVYTSPFLYIKNGAEWSLVRLRHNTPNNFKKQIGSWIGTPFGPDTCAFELKATYDDIQKFKFGLSYLFVAHGENSFGIFQNKTKVTVDGKDDEYYSYYPVVIDNISKLPSNKFNNVSEAELLDISQNQMLRGIVQYTNRITADAEYKINDHVTLKGQLDYTFIFNNENITGNFQQGLEGVISCEIRAFN